jgi:hypothetical protein
VETLEAIAVHFIGLFSKHITMPEIIGLSKSIFGFDPRSIGGCVLWLDGADATTLFSDTGGSAGSNSTVGNPVRRWKDKSGQSNDFSNQSASGVFPTYASGGGVFLSNAGSPIYNVNTFNCLRSVTSNLLAFPYYTVYTVVNATVSSNITLPLLFACVRRPDGESRSPNFGLGGSFSLGGPGVWAGAISNARFSFGDTTGASTGEQISNNVTTVAGLMSGRVSNTTSLAGTRIASSGSLFYVPFTTCTAPCFIGGAFYFVNSNTPDNRFLNGTIYETLVFNAELTRGQCEEIEGYLSWKWGRQTALPTTHPFRNIAPLARGFTPIDIPNCQLWLDAADASSVTGTTTVTAWRDKSGNGRNLSVGSGTTSYASNAITLSNSYMLVTSAVNLTAFTFFIVAKSNTATNNQTVFGARPNNTAVYNSTDGFGFYMDYQTSVRLYGQLGTPSTNSVTTSTPVIFSYTSEPSILNAWINGASSTGAGSQLARTSTAQGFAIGAEWGGSSYVTNVSNVSIYEIIVYNTSLTNVQRQAVEGYLAWKWNLNTSLSTSNSLRRFPTSSVSQFKPTDINACSLWLDAADPAATGGGSTLTNWTDKSGLGNTATSGSGTIAITSNGLTFDGSKYMTVAGLAGALANTPFIIFTVETFTGSSGYYFGDDNVNSGGAADSSLHIGYRSQTRHTFAFYADDLEDFAVSGSGFQRIMTNWLPQASNRSTRRNGAVDVTHVNSNRLTAFTAPRIGRAFGTNNYVGTISELIVYTSDIDLQNVLRVEGYLSKKWNIPLATTHPYYAIDTAHMVGGTAIVTPSNLPGLLVWNRGDTLAVGNGNTINTWTNSTNASGPTITCTGTQSNSQLNGLSVANLTTAQRWSSASTLNPSNYTFIQVSRQTPSTYGRVFQSSVPGTNFIHGYWGSLKQPWYAEGWLTFVGGGVNSAMNEWAIITSARIQGGAFQCRWNGAVIAAGGSSSNFPLQGLAVNGAGAQSGEVSTCQLAEVILYDSVLTNPQIIGIEEYLRQKWGLGLN